MIGKEERTKSLKNKKILSLAIASVLVASSIGVVFVILYIPRNPPENLDNTNPIVTIINPTNATHRSASLTITINAMDDGSVDKIWYNWNGTNVTYDSPRSVQFAEGTNKVLAWANDSAGNVGSTSLTFTVDTRFSRKRGINITHVYC